MRDLIPSGRFAQLARLTRKALRVYAEHGLLRPVYTDQHSGYHYYSLSQLEEARRIASLRSLGMSIELIQSVLRVWHTPDVLEHFEQHRTNLLQQADALRDAIGELDRLLAQEPPSYTVSTRRVQPQRCIATRTRCDPSATCAFIDAAEVRLRETLRAAYLDPAGPLIVRYHEGSDDDRWDVEVCLPLTGDLYRHLPPDVNELQLGGGLAASTIHAGDCGGDWGLQAAYEAVWTWVRDHGHDTLGPPYEVYLFDERNTANPADYRTEIGWLIE